MKRATLTVTIAIFVLSFIACNSQNKTNKEIEKTDSSLNEKTNDMKSFISIFEIPATDISRAIAFYQTILDLKIEQMEIPGMEMGILPYEGQMVTGVIIKGEGYKPSADGVTIYLNAGVNLQIILDKIEGNGGKIIVPKTPHGDESGYFALFIDSEGNRMGLHSPN